MRREKEGPSGVHLDSKVRRVKGINLYVKCSIRIADRKSEMFHLPGCVWKLPFSNVLPYGVRGQDEVFQHKNQTPSFTQRCVTLQAFFSSDRSSKLSLLLCSVCFASSSVWPKSCYSGLTDFQSFNFHVLDTQSPTKKLKKHSKPKVPELTSVETYKSGFRGNESFQNFHWKVSRRRVRFAWKVFWTLLRRNPQNWFQQPWKLTKLSLKSSQT